METIVSLGRDGTAVLCAEAAPGGIKMVARKETRTASLLANGRPDHLAGPLLDGLLAEAEAPRRVRLLLPPAATALKKAEIAVPRTGRLTGALLDEAISNGRRALYKENSAFVTMRPVGYRMGGQRLAEAPLGRPADGLTVELLALAAPLGLLADFDAVLRAAGAETAGVISAPQAAAAGLLREGEGVAVVVGYDATLAVAAEDGVLTAQARVPLGRRHLQHDLAAAFDLTPQEASRTLERVLAKSGEKDAAHVVGMRAEEQAKLLLAAAARAGVPLSGPVILHGLPPGTLPGLEKAVPPPPRTLPKGLEDAPLLAGAARLAHGLSGGLDEAVIAAAPPQKEGLLAWLKRRF